MENFTKKVTFKQRLKRGGVRYEDVWEESVPGIRNSKCNEPVAQV